MLKSSNIAIKLVSDKEIQKLQFNHRLITILEEKISISIKTYGIIVHGVSIAKVDIKDVDKVQWFIMQNTDSFSNINIKWIECLTAQKIGKKKASLVFQLDNTKSAKQIFHESLVIGCDIHQCIKYNRECKIKQRLLLRPSLKYCSIFLKSTPLNISRRFVQN